MKSAIRDSQSAINQMSLKNIAMSDPDDEMYINLAIVANATHLVSRDQDLLDLMTSTEVGRQFRSRYPFLRIMKAAEFVAEMESRKIGS